MAMRFWFSRFYDTEFLILRRRICNLATHKFYDKKSTNFKSNVSSDALLNRDYKTFHHISYNSDIVNTTNSQIKFYQSFETYGELLFENEPLEENVVMT